MHPNINPHYLNDLNEVQRKAVEWLDGPELVIAGAGSGKTRVLTYKIIHLLAQGYKPYRILALTFTNKAAAEMRQRIESLTGDETARELWMGTFHSIFARILRRHADRLGFTSNYTIYDTSDSKALIKTIIKDMNLDDKEYKPTTVLNTISTAKNALISPIAYRNDRDLMEMDKRARRSRMVDIYEAYTNRCKVSGVMDFDDLLYYTNVLFRDNKDILEHYQEYFQYVLVDEYQDTNFAQHAIITRLCERYHNLCVVGDDAQSIYSFRGANIRNILNMKKGYPDLAIFKLEQNYRSTENIVNAASSLIAKNTMQIPKNVYSTNGAGEKVEVIRCFSDYQEGHAVAAKIQRLRIQQKSNYNDFAILYRTNAQSRILEESLRKVNIPYRIYGGLAFYQRKEVKDAISYFRLTVNPHDDEALKRVINTPSRGIGDKTVGKLVSVALEQQVSIWTVLTHLNRYDIPFNSGTVKKLTAFSSLISSLHELDESGMDAGMLADEIITKSNLMGALLSDSTPENISRRQNIQELLNAAYTFVEERRESGAEPSELSMQQFITTVSLATDSDNEEDPEGKDDQRVTLMTIHSAKGLEFDNIIVVGVEEDLLPSSMSLGSAAEIEEERRLLYVAITRAKRYCMLSFAGSRFLNGQTRTCRASRFLNDMDARFLKFNGSASDIQDFDSDSRARLSFHSPVFTPRPNNVSGWGNRPPRQSNTTVSQTVVSSDSDLDMRLHSASELRVGMNIIHSRFGRGVIRDIHTDSPEHAITVRFGQNDTKKLLLKFAKFSILFDNE